jgi:hypothetical protein
MTGTAEVIQLDAFRGKSAVQRKRRTSIVRAERPQREQGETETGRNFRLRQERRSDWCRADSIREYWKAARAMDSAIHRVQQSELPEGDLHQPLVPGSWKSILAKYRAAIMAQLLTPAPTAREIEWKRAVFKHGDHKHTDIKPERIERAIAEDVEFLRSHPTRRGGGRSSKPDQEQ